MKSYTTGQVAKLVGVGRDTIYRWLRSGKIPAGETTRLGAMQVMVWTDRELAAIREYIKKHPYDGRGRKREKDKRGQK